MGIYTMEIFYVRDKCAEFMCGGTIISRTTMLTGIILYLSKNLKYMFQHFDNKGQTIKKRTQDIRIRLGAYNLNDNFENGIVSLSHNCS